MGVHVRYVDPPYSQMSTSVTWTPPPESSQIWVSTSVTRTPLIRIVPNMGVHVRYVDPPYESEHCPRLSRKLKGGSAGNRRGQLGVTDVDQTKKDATLKTFPGHNNKWGGGAGVLPLVVHQKGGGARVLPLVVHQKGEELGCSRWSFTRTSVTKVGQAGTDRH